jgi:hypothetical protein
MKTIKDMPEHSPPREKLQEKGPQALSDEELVAAILGMGVAGVNVRTIASATSMLRCAASNVGAPVPSERSDGTERSYCHQKVQDAYEM